MQLCKTSASTVSTWRLVSMLPPTTVHVLVLRENRWIGKTELQKEKKVSFSTGLSFLFVSDEKKNSWMAFCLLL